MAVALIDLGGFDEMKDAIGDAGEDEVLTEIANRLRRDVPEGALIARLRGDKFGLVMRAADADEALAVVQAMRDAVSRADLGRSGASRSAPMRGWRSLRATATNRDELMRRADLALRNAKRRGRGLVMQFSADMEGDFDERRFIKRELSRALATRSFELHYQPIVRADGGAIVGVESLLRWNHPSRGYIPPGLFVPVAEDAGTDGSARRVRAAARAGRRRALAGPLRRGQPVAGAGARPPVRRPGRARCSPRPRPIPRAWCWRSPRAC